MLVPSVMGVVGPVPVVGSEDMSFITSKSGKDFGTRFLFLGMQGPHSPSDDWRNVLYSKRPLHAFPSGIVSNWVD